MLSAEGWQGSAATWHGQSRTSGKAMGQLVALGKDDLPSLCPVEKVKLRVWVVTGTPGFFVLDSRAKSFGG